MTNIKQGMTRDEGMKRFGERPQNWLTEANRQPGFYPISPAVGPSSLSIERYKISATGHSADGADYY